MFKNEFQGGAYVELFTAQGKNPLSKLKLAGAHTSIKKEFDNELRTFIINIEGEPARTKILFPKNSKQSLHVTQPYLVFQVFIPAGRSFSLEVSITGQNNTKQRLIFSSSNREVVITALHTKMPCSLIETNIWLNLCLDLNELIGLDDNSFSVLDSIVVAANCKLRKIFALKDRPNDNNDLPKNFQLGDGPSLLQILDMAAFYDAGINVRSGTGRHRKASKSLTKSNSIDQSHIAFGTRVVTHRESPPLSNTGKLEKCSSDRRVNTISDYSNGKVDDEVFIITKNFVPRPPKEAQGRVRRPRIKSADYSKAKVLDETKKQPLSKSADTRSRRKPDSSSESVSLNSSKRMLSKISGIGDKVSNPLPPVKLKKKISKCEMGLDSSADNEINATGRNMRYDVIKSSSLSVLPKIKQKTKNLKGENERDNQMESCNYEEEDSLNFKNDDDGDDVEKSNESEDRYGKNEPLTFGDDTMIEEYLHRRKNDSHDEDSFSSSCADSFSNDLHMFLSKPKTITAQEKREPSRKEEREDYSTYKPDLFENENVVTENRNRNRKSSDTNYLQNVSSSQKAENPILSTEETEISVNRKTSNFSRTSNDDGTKNENRKGSTYCYSSNFKDFAESSESKIEQLNEEKDLSMKLDAMKIRHSAIESSSLKERSSEDQEDFKTSHDLELSRKETNKTTQNRLANSSSGVSSSSETDIQPIISRSTPKISQQLEFSNKTSKIFQTKDTSELQATNLKKHNNNLTTDLNNNEVISKNYEKPTDSMASDTMSWLIASQSELSKVDNHVKKSHSSNLNTSPKTLLRKRLEEQFGSLLVQSKDTLTDDGFSSDDTSSWEPPPKFHNYRYQDDFDKSLSSTMDLTQTMPETFLAEELANAVDENNNESGKKISLLAPKDDHIKVAYDPMLNCYYDPVTLKYYELA